MLPKNLLHSFHISIPFLSNKKTFSGTGHWSLGHNVEQDIM